MRGLRRLGQQGDFWTRLRRTQTRMRKQWDNPSEYDMPEGVRVPASMNIGGVEVAPATVLAPTSSVAGPRCAPSPLRQWCPGPATLRRRARG